MIYPIQKSWEPLFCTLSHETNKINQNVDPKIYLLESIFKHFCQRDFFTCPTYFGWNWVGLGWDWVWGDRGLRGWGLGLDN